jgi:putative ABC transporter-associated repeat protein
VPGVRLAAIVLALLLASPAVAQEAQQRKPVGSGEKTVTGQKVIADGHLDLGPRFVDGRWTIQVRDDATTPPVWRNLPDLVMHAVDAARVRVPAGFGFLGRPGARVWLLPQVQERGILWPGWNTQDPTVADRVVREVTWRLHGVRGPGRFVLFLTDAFGEPRILFDSARPYPQETGIEVDTHVHGNWAFTAPGVHALDIEMRARLKDGATVSDRAALRLAVGSGDPAAAFEEEDGSDPVWLWFVGGFGIGGGAAAGVLLLRRRAGAR